MSTISEPSWSSRMRQLARSRPDRARGKTRAMRRLRSAKIVATLGPASASPERLRALFDAGVDVFRLNFSHGSHAEKRQLFEDIRRVESDTGRPIGILADLQGPKLRVGHSPAATIAPKTGAPFPLHLHPTPGHHHPPPF